jgi:3alpha(or 20beta)-hydroxysteroid dehydrogenase
MARLTGKVAIVTGAAQGMGEAHARMFVDEGAKVILTDINAELGSVLAKELGANAMFIKHDVTKIEDWQSVIKQGEAKFGTVNVLINNAGVLGPIGGIVDMSEKDFETVCSINQTGVFLGMKAVIPSMLKAGIGSIVNVSSIAGLLVIVGTPNPAYVASKFAVRGMTKYAAVEFGPKNIRCNSVHPGYIKTPMMVQATAEDGAGAASAIPLRRMADASEVASLMVFLASDESSFLTGTEQVIDGGMILQ